MKPASHPAPDHDYLYDCTIGPFHLLKGEVLKPNDNIVTWMLHAFEDRFWMFTPRPSRIQLKRLGSDWFNLGGFDKLQSYYVHYQDAYLLRDQIPNFLRCFFNTLAAIADPQTLTFQEQTGEQLNMDGDQPHKTHEEGWFFHQLRGMLVLEMDQDLYLAKGVPRAWLADGKQINVERAASHFGETSYRIESFSGQNRIEATVLPPRRNVPHSIFLRLRHPSEKRLRAVTVDGRPWSEFDPQKEWIRLPLDAAQIRVVARY